MDDDGDGTITKEEFMKLGSVMEKLKHINIDFKNIGNYMNKKVFFRNIAMSNLVIVSGCMRVHYNSFYKNIKLIESKEI